jgi:hypothetical protein
MNYYCYSSTIFLTNSILAFVYDQYLYSCLFAALAGTSVLFHSSPTLATNILDKVPIVCIVLYGGMIFFDNYERTLIRVKEE